MDVKQFRSHAHELVDWMAEYLERVEEYPVKSPCKPGEILKVLPAKPPLEGEPFENIFADFQTIIVPGMTHWQSPNFFAYFPANSSPPSLLAEMLISTLGAQCMSWQTSPAATELEERVMYWLGGMIGLPDGFTGVIQDTASTATLCSILSAREKVSDYGVNADGLYNSDTFTVYCSTETHSSIEKAVKIAGLGKNNLRKVAVDDSYAMDPGALEAAIENDIASGLKPLCVVAATGTTGSTAMDPLRAIGEICRKYKVWMHVDAAFAGTALVLEHYRHIADGLELADTFVFNPHKWMFTNFDCSAYFVKDREALVRTFEILPEYLKTAEGDAVNNYRDWGIQLGRRFRALKLWFVIRSYGVRGIQKMVQDHINMAQTLAAEIQVHEHFELLAPVPLNVICFRYHPDGVDDRDALNELNERLMSTLNESGKMYLTHTKLKGNLTLRLVIGQTHTSVRHVGDAWRLIQKTVATLS